MEEKEIEQKQNEKKETKSIAWGVILTYVRLGLLIVISVFYPPFLVKHLGQEVNGLFQFAATMPGWLAMLSLGVENSYIKFAIRNKEKGGDEGLAKTNGFYTLIFGAIALLVFIAGLVVAFMYKNGILTFESTGEETYKDLVFLMIIILVFSWSIDFALGVFRMYINFSSHFGTYQVWRLLQRAVIVGGSVAACLLFKDNKIAAIYVAISTLAGQVVLDLCCVLTSVFKLKIKLKMPDKEFSKPLFKQVFVFSLFVFLTIIVNTVNQNLGRTALGSLYSVSAVTIFTYSIQFYDYGDLISKGISDSFAPRINRYVVQDRKSDIDKTFLNVAKAQMLVMFMIVGGFIACGREFAYAWMWKSIENPHDIDALYYMSAAMLIIWLIPFCQTVGIEIQRAYNKHKFIAVFNLAAALLNIVITIVCIKYLPDDFKIYGPVVGMGFAVISGMVIASNIYYSKVLKLPIKKFFLNALLMLGISALAVAAVYLIYGYAIKLPEDMNKWFVTIIRGASFLVVYLPIVFIFYRKRIIELTKRFFKRG